MTDEDGCYSLLERSTDSQGRVVETFASSGHTASPWGPTQHAGPVAALLTRAMDRLDHPAGTRITKVSVDLLGAVPIAPVRVVAWVERPGRRVSVLSAVLEVERDGSWRPVARASAWRLATQDTRDAVWLGDAPLLPRQTSSAGRGLPESWPLVGFVGAVTWHVVDPGDRPGRPTQAWLRLDQPLVAGEATRPLETVMAIADTVNGLGARLDPRSWTFLNTELTVHLHAELAGEWCGLAAETTVGPDGVAMSAGVLHGEGGPIGRVTQTVLVERR